VNVSPADNKTMKCDCKWTSRKKTDGSQSGRLPGKAHCPQ